MLGEKRRIFSLNQYDADSTKAQVDVSAEVPGSLPFSTSILNEPSRDYRNRTIQDYLDGAEERKERDQDIFDEIIEKNKATRE